MDAWNEQDDVQQEPPPPDPHRVSAPRASPHAAVLLLITLGVLAGYITIASLRQDIVADMGYPTNVGYVTTCFIAGIVLAAIAAGVAYFVSRRSVTVARWTYCVALALALLGQVRRVERIAEVREDNASAVAGLRLEAETLVDEMGTGRNSSVPGLDRMIATYERMGRKGHGEMVVAARAQAQLLREFRAPIMAYEEAGLAWSALTEKAVEDNQVVAEHLDALRRLEEAGRALQEVQAAAAERLDALLAEAGIGRAARRHYTRAYRQQSPYRAELWRRRAAFIEVERGPFQLLQQNPDGWAYDPQQGGIVYEDAKLERAIEAVVAREDEAAAAVIEAEQMLQQHMKSRLREMHK